MTSYHGGKQKSGKIIAQKIYDNFLKINENFKIKGYCEPFVGMCGVYQHIPELFEDYNIKYIAGDINENVILMWKKSQKGWKPPEKITETLYNKLKKSPNNSALKGYVGHQYSFAGQFFKGYAPKYGKTFNSQKVIEKIYNISENLKNVNFKYGDYTQFSKLKGYIIYCDPPYNQTHKKYKEYFDSEKFIDWCRYMSENNIIFLSEYNAPKDFKKIYTKKHSNTGNITQKKGKDRLRIENLYIL